MANEITYDFPLKQDAYAAFDAISLRNLIIQRLNDQGLVTDQNYIGSNLASIIDIVSFSFNTLIYYLNKTSNESMFSEAQLYENINRIVKILNYKPIGYQTSTLSFTCTTNSFRRGVFTIPRYSYLMVGGVPYSFNEDITFSILENFLETNLTDISNRKLLFQGSFRENPLYIASGDKTETVTINVTNALIDHFNVHVYVYEQKQKRWFVYKEAPDINNYRSFDRVFEKRLNSNSFYEVTFGDGISGRKLETGDKVAIYYLQSSGEAGVIGPGALNFDRTSGMFSIIYTTPLYEEIIKSINEENYVYIDSSQFSLMRFNNAVGSTIPKDVETAEEIRKNAPHHFKSQLRLVTQEDFEGYIKTNFANFVSDVKVFNNWDYVGKYLKYFYEINLNPGGFKQIPLNQVLYADSCNFNNIYICGVPKVSIGSTLKYLLPAQKELIASNTSNLKPLTTEITFLDPLFKSLDFGVTQNNEVIVESSNACRLELIKSSMSARSNRAIEQDAIVIFKTVFDLTKAKLGQVIDYSGLINKLMSISGVSKLVTRNTETNQSFEGLSFFLWNPLYPALDKQVIFNNTVLREFELLYFNNLATIDNKIVARSS